MVTLFPTETAAALDTELQYKRYVSCNRVHTVMERTWKVMEFETCIPGLEKSWNLGKCVRSWKSHGISDFYLISFESMVDK